MLNFDEAKKLEDLDKGPWSVMNRSTDPRDPIGVLSNDFELDVLLRVSGDMLPEQKAKYCQLLADKLNGGSEVEPTNSYVPINIRLYDTGDVITCNTPEEIPLGVFFQVIPVWVNG